MATIGNSGGSGGGAREIEAGRAFVSIGVKDNLTTGLQKSSRSVAKFAQDARKQFGEGLAEGATGVSAGKLGLGLGVGAVAIAGGRELVSQIREGVLGANSYAKLFEKMAESTDKAAENAARITEQFAKAAAFERGGPRATTREKEARELKQLLEEQEQIQGRLSAMQYKQQRGTGDLIRSREFGSAFGRFARWAGSGVGLADSSEELAEKTQANLDKVTATIADIQKRIREASSESERIRNPFSDPEFFNRVRDFRQEMADAIDSNIAAMGEYERAAFLMQRENKDANAESQRRLALLREEAKRIDEVVKATEERKRKEEELKASAQRIQDDFTSELRNATLGLQTRGLGGEDARLAGLVTRGFSNDQIMRLRAIDLQTRTAAVTASGGQNIYSQFGAAGLESSRSAFGGERKELKQEVELTNEKLEMIRQALASISTDFK